MRRRSAALGSAIFFAVAPGVMAGLVPWLLTGWDAYAMPVALRVLGALVTAAGAAFLIQAFVRFVVEGLGTPAPVAPPERLVVGGIYRWVRNPMYVAVIATILGRRCCSGESCCSCGRCCSGRPPRRSCAGTRSPICGAGSARSTRST